MKSWSRGLSQVWWSISLSYLSHAWKLMHLSPSLKQTNSAKPWHIWSHRIAEIQMLLRLRHLSIFESDLRLQTRSYLLLPHHIYFDAHTDSHTIRVYQCLSVFGLSRIPFVLPGKLGHCPQLHQRQLFWTKSSPAGCQWHPCEGCDRGTMSSCIWRWKILKKVKKRDRRNMMKVVHDRSW